MAFLSTEYILHIAIIICIYSIIAVSLQLIIGFTGMLNIGHIAFVGIGAYTAALLTHPTHGLGLPFIVGFIAAPVTAGIAGFLVGIPALKLRGDYLAIATLGFGEITRAVMKNWSTLTRGPLGLPGITKPEFFGFHIATKEAMLMLTIIIAVLCIAMIWKLVHSPFGRTLKAIREDEIAALSLGKNVRKYKITALVIGAAWAGIAGALYAHYISFIDPTTFSFVESVMLVCMVILGGLGSISGAVVGAIIVTLIPQPLRFIGFPADITGALRQIIFALILIALMLWKPEGIIPEKTKG